MSAASADQTDELAEGNVALICKDCATKKYPHKGKFTKEQLLHTTYVKKSFSGEHMWVKVTSVDEDGTVHGTVANVPVMQGRPAFGSQVDVKQAEVEETESHVWRKPK